ncbi:helix-turn-helix domain-containing protein [Sphaerisporangium sp. NPDC005289]|uniref:TetR/AcrR family transcriptional regulator n=1 Tax=Sphaerisporangium sp. NPDC005289 TaxID=3155247 RepID=UPI0033A1AF77
MTETRRRASGMTPEQRRDMIVKAALPLVAEHGAAVTTAQVARAAAIGEATIFRVFADKDALLDACVLQALDPARALREIAEVPLDQPLAARLAEAAEALRAHLDRMGAVIGALHATGRAGRPGPGRDAAGDGRRGGGEAVAAAGRGGPDAGRGRGEADAAGAGDGAGAAAGGDEPGAVEGRDRPAGTTGREASVARTIAAVAELFEPERASLRLPPERLAAIYLSMLYARPGLGGGDREPVRAQELAEVFVHGALA